METETEEQETGQASLTFPAFTHPRYWAPFVLMGQWK
jgi:CHAT domain-containing protein